MAELVLDLGSAAVCRFLPEVLLNHLDGFVRRLVMPEGEVARGKLADPGDAPLDKGGSRFRDCDG